MNFQEFLDQVEEIKKKAEKEIKEENNRTAVTSLHSKYLGPKGQLEESYINFTSLNTSSDQLQMSKEAFNKSKKFIKGSIINKIKEITFKEIKDGSL
jgi:ABC-type Zn uptake system ZnuABC Zn-binding protein ZnuA